MARSTIVITHNRFPVIAAALPVLTSAAVRKAALDVEAYAKTIVPVDTGALKNSITTEFEGDFSATVAPHTEYDVYVEFGTRHMSAQPYMTPAAEVVRPAFIDAMEQLLRRL